MFARIWQMVIKEYIQVVRNKDSLFLLAVTPVLQLMLLGYGITYEVRHISTAFLDLDNSAESRELISRFGASLRQSGRGFGHAGEHRLDAKHQCQREHARTRRNPSAHAGLPLP